MVSPSDLPTPDEKPRRAGLNRVLRRTKRNPKDAPERTPPSAENEEDEPFALPFPFGQRDPLERRTSMGTGMVVSADGFILTNHHIVKDATRFACC
jgi:serine protease Do